MPITIDKTIEAEIKTQKLRSLMVRYIELNMDKVAHTANGLAEAATSLQKEMDKVQTAYDAIQAMA